MGSGGVPNRNIEKTYARNLKKTGNPNTRVDRYNNDDELMQSRWYGKNGQAERNRDYKHGGNYNFPHDHSWSWHNGEGERGKEHLAPNYDYN